MDQSSKIYGAIQFDRWYDHTIFHKVVEGRYKPNEIGEQVKITNPMGGGSAWLNFEPNKIEQVIQELKKHGYKVFTD